MTRFRQGAGLALAALFVIAGCGSGGTESTAPSGNTPSAGTAKVTDPSVAFADLPEPYNTADYSNGRRQFRLCASCHAISPDMTALVGPNLYGLFGRQVGTAQGFRFSSALTEADFEWTPEKLEEWLANPRTFLPGNAMSFAGIRNESDRHDVIAYLMVETAK